MEGFRISDPPKNTGKDSEFLIPHNNEIGVERGPIIQPYPNFIQNQVLQPIQGRLIVSLKA